MDSTFTGERLAEEYRAARLRIEAMLDGISADQEQIIVPTCPEWTIRDLLSHNEGLAADLSQGHRPEGELQDWIDGHVADRRDVPVAEQLASWQSTGAAFEDALVQFPQMASLVFDVITHEHDFAGALGMQSDRDSSGVALVMELQASMIANDLAEHGLGAVRVVAGDTTYDYGTGEPGLELRGSLFEMFRLTGSRRSRAQIDATDHTGDLATYLPGLLHNPVPVSDIIE